MRCYLGAPRSLGGATHAQHVSAFLDARAGLWLADLSHMTYGFGSRWYKPF